MRNTFWVNRTNEELRIAMGELRRVMDCLAMTPQHVATLRGMESEIQAELQFRIERGC